MTAATESAARQSDAVDPGVVADPQLAATVAGPPGADGLASIEISLGLAGGDRIIVNGHDVSRSVIRTSVHVDRGSPAFPVAVLELRQGAADISGPGIVQILPSADGAPVVVAQAVADWLEGVDPNALDQALLNAGMGVSPGESCLQALAAMARTGGAR